MPRKNAQAKRKTPAPAPTPTRAPSRRRAPQAPHETPSPAISGPDVHHGPQQSSRPLSSRLTSQNMRRCCRRPRRPRIASRRPQRRMILVVRRASRPCQPPSARPWRRSSRPSGRTCRPSRPGGSSGNTWPSRMMTPTASWPGRRTMSSSAILTPCGGNPISPGKAMRQSSTARSPGVLQEGSPGYTLVDVSRPRGGVSHGQAHHQ